MKGLNRRLRTLHAEQIKSATQRVAAAPLLQSIPGFEELLQVRRRSTFTKDRVQLIR